MVELYSCWKLLAVGIVGNYYSRIRFLVVTDSTLSGDVAVSQINKIMVLLGHNIGQSKKHIYRKHSS